MEHTQQECVLRACTGSLRNSGQYWVPRACLGHRGRGMWVSRPVASFQGHTGHDLCFVVAGYQRSGKHWVMLRSCSASLCGTMHASTSMGARLCGASHGPTEHQSVLRESARSRNRAQRQCVPRSFMVKHQRSQPKAKDLQNSVPDHKLPEVVMVSVKSLKFRALRIVKNVASDVHRFSN